METPKGGGLVRLLLGSDYYSYRSVLSAIRVGGEFPTPQYEVKELPRHTLFNKP